MTNSTVAKKAAMTKKNKSKKQGKSKRSAQVASGISKSDKPKSPKLDPDRLAELEQERDSLLVSIADLEREHDAGDLDDDDYRTLRDGYTVRAASVLRSIEGHRDEAARSSSKPSAQRRLVSGAIVCAFALIVGLFLARTLGERGVDDALSGSIDTSRRDQVINCRRLGEDQKLAASLECYDEVIEVDPTNAEALTYRGWFRVLQVDALTAAGETEVAQQLLAAGQLDLNLAIEIDPTVPDAFAFRAVVHSRLERSEAACDDLASLLALDPPQFYLSQTARIAEVNNC